MKTQQVFVDDVDIVDRMRAFDEGRVTSLAESIKAIGLRTPISIWCPSPQVMRLVAGRHRLEAVRRLGKEMIDAIVVDMDELDRDLWEIDENLCRAELSDVEEAEHLARRQELWEAKKVKNLGGQSMPTLKPRYEEGFASETAKAIGKKKRAINQAIKRAHEVTSEARAIIRNTALDTGAYLDKLMKIEPGEQLRTAQRALDDIVRRQRDESLRREKAERDRESKEAKKNAKLGALDMLLGALTPAQWGQFIELVEQSGGKITSKEMREWQSPMGAAA